MRLAPFDTPQQTLSRLMNQYEFSGSMRHNNGNNGVLHVVTSRFMQGQSNLTALAKARLQLFETFCLPTMLNQNVDNFLWFVMTDPQLDPESLRDLRLLLEPYPNFYLATSHAQTLTPLNLTTIMSAESHESDTNGHQNLLLTGDIELLQKQILDPSRSLLLETRLDADDGLHFSTLSHLQKIAKALPVDTEGWQIICSNIHFEWRNDDIIAFDLNTTKIESSGKLRVVRESICVTPGFTLVRHREPQSTDFPAWPNLRHNVVVRDWPECRIENASSLGDIVETNNGNATRDCWKKMGFFPSALRSRTVTSAGMSRIVTEKKNSAKYENRTKKFWQMVQRDFDITPESARSTSQYMKDHLQSIAYDNLQGQW